MHQRKVQAPGGGLSDLVTTAEAAAFMSIGDDYFEQLARDERGWMRPVYFGRAKRWHWLDVFVLAHLHRQRQLVGPRKGAGEEETEKS